MSLLGKRCFCASLTILGILIVVRVYRSHIGEVRLVALLDGDQRVGLQSLEINGQQRRVLCTDRDVLHYFKEILTKHPRFDSALGSSYHIRIAFTDGETVNNDIFVHAHGFAISVNSRAVEKGFPTHSVSLISPVPEKVRRIFDFMGEPCEKVAGTILSIEDNKTPEMRFDASLVAH